MALQCDPPLRVGNTRMRVRDRPNLAYFANVACVTKHSCDTGHHSTKPVV